LRNHDELTLEMVTDDERDYMYQEYAKDPRMRLNMGIRRRLAPLMDNGRRQIELMYCLLLSLPGSPVLYYGDEIGMGDNIYLGDRNGVRTPMQWSGDRNAGFSRSDPSQLYLPVITDPGYHYQAVNVEAQERSATSRLNWVKRMLAVRRKHPVFGRGTIEFIETGNRKVLGFVRRQGVELVLVVCNLSRFAQPATLELSAYLGMSPVEIIGGQPFPSIGAAPYPVTMSPHAFFWFELRPRGPAS
jgi:maltose alpha-D-glucosyltransferase/alpha-amylase